MLSMSTKYKRNFFYKSILGTYTVGMEDAIQIDQICVLNQSVNQ